MIAKINIILGQMSRLLVNDFTLKSRSPLNFLERFYLNLLAEQLEWYVLNRPRDFLECVEFRYKHKLNQESIQELQKLLMNSEITPKDSFMFYKLYL